VSSTDALRIAVDLGAGSGRVIVAGVGPAELRLDEVRRFRYPAERRDGHLRWPFASIRAEVEAGLAQAAALARAMNRRVASVGVDSWGVDYGLLDPDGRLLEDPICYRDERTATAMDEVFQRLPRGEIFARTGIQFLAFNTLFQLHAHTRMGLPAAATKMLMIPDLLHQALSGRAVTEYTNATTTQLLQVGTGRWDDTLLETLGLPGQLLPEVVPAGSDLGPLLSPTTEGMAGARVIAPATHDTASAVAGTPLEEGWAYVSSGTWSLVGVERSAPLVDAEVARHNFTNEGGAFGTVRFLKNVMGLWLYESCRREWGRHGLPCDHATLLAAAAAGNGMPALIFPDDLRLFNPGDMRSALADQLRETGQTASDDPVATTRTILDSLAFRYASVLRTIETLTGRTIPGVHIVGGGCQNDYLDQATANATGKPVLAGPVEATAIGNVLVQAIAAGRFPSLAAARDHVRLSAPPRRFEPRRDAHWQAAARRYAEIEQRFSTS